MTNLVFMLWAGITSTVFGQEEVKRHDPPLYQTKDHPMKYYLSLPEGWTKEKNWDIIVALPGGGGEFREIFDVFTRARKSHPFIVVTPMTLSTTASLITSAKAGAYAYTADLLMKYEFNRMLRYEFDLEGISKVLNNVTSEFSGMMPVHLYGFSGGNNIIQAMMLTRPWLIKSVCLAGPSLDVLPPIKTPHPSYYMKLPVRVFQGSEDKYLQWLDLAWNTMEKIYSFVGLNDVSRELLKGRGHEPFHNKAIKFFYNNMNGTTTNIELDHKGRTCRYCSADKPYCYQKGGLSKAEKKHDMMQKLSKLYSLSCVQSRALDELTKINWEEINIERTKLYEVLSYAERTDMQDILQELSVLFRKSGRLVCERQYVQFLMGQLGMTSDSALLFYVLGKIKEKKIYPGQRELICDLVKPYFKQTSPYLTDSHGLSGAIRIAQLNGTIIERLEHEKIVKVDPGFLVGSRLGKLSGVFTSATLEQYLKHSLGMSDGILRKIETQITSLIKEWESSKLQTEELDAYKKFIGALSGILSREEINSLMSTSPRDIFQILDYIDF